MTNQEIINVLNVAAYEIENCNDKYLSIWDAVTNSWMNKTLGKKSMVDFIKECPEMGMPMWINGGIESLLNLIAKYNKLESNKHLLDFQSISRYIQWNHNRTPECSVSENQFIQAWGQQMGTHYWQKYFRTFNSDIFQMVAYFRGETENGELFIGMVNECIAKYESRLNKVFISK